MIPTSAAYKQAMNGPRTFLVQVTVTFRDETVEVWDNSRLMSLSFEEATSDTGTFTVGSAIIGKLSLSVLNHDDAYSELDFIGAVMQVKIGVATTNGTEYMNRGTFTVDTAKADSGAIVITALDNLSKLDVPYHTASDLEYPASLDQIYRDVCTSCGVYPATVGFLNDDFVVQNRPAEDYTCREILSAVATMAGCFAKADQNGEIMLGWYDGLKELWEKTDYDGGTFDSSTPYYASGDSLDGGVFDNGSPYYASGDSVDGGSFSDMDDYFHLYSSASQEIDIDDIEITGVEVLITSESEGETTENTYLFGEEGYLISISENPLIQSYDEDMLMAVANKLIGMRFRKFSMSGRSDPAYETGDSGYVSDRKGNSYISILTSISFEVNGYEGFTCDAESVLERNMTRYNETARNFTKVVQKTEQMVNEEKTARELAIEQLTNRVNNSSGLFTTIETQSDGSKIFKLHDKPTLEESQIVWTMTAEAWTVSTNGGASPNAGMTVDGDTIVRILTATGINADWINSGTIRAINIVGSTISGAEIVGGTIRTATIEGYVDDNTFNEEIETVLDDIGALQEQSDKKAETWYQSSDPSTAWTTATLKQEHTGDIWYNTSASVQKSYRWNGSTWQEMKTSPPDEVFDEIDGKAQIFVSQPSPPYAVGDLWFNSTTSDIMTCIKDRASGSYVASDWQKRNKYTDNSFAEEVQEELRDLQIGGRNLILNSGFDNASNQYYRWYFAGTNTHSIEDASPYGNCLTFEFTSAGSNSNRIYSSRPDSGVYHVVGKRYAFSVYAKSATAGTQLRVTEGGSQEIGTFTLTTEWTKYTATYTGRSTTSLTFWVVQANQEVSIAQPKLEYGNKPTDWSPAPEDTETYVDDLAADLQSQIDGKIQTYSQTSDPSSSWTTTALKTQHTGDLWYNPNTKLTRRWSGSAWVTLESAEAEEAAELAQTKAQIFISTPTVPYYQGDLWFNSASSDIMTCIRDRTSGSYTASDWQKRNKYTDDSLAEEVQAELQSMQIGGRNLIPNTNDMGKYVISGGLTVITDDEGYSVVNYPATTTLAWRSFATKNNIRYTNVRNKEVTVSFEYRSDSWTPSASGSGNNYPVLSLDISNVSETSNSRDAYWSYYSSAIGQPSTEWKKFVHTVNVTDALFTGGTGDPTESSWFYAHVFNHSLNHMQVRKFKIEIGSKATDWSPAPEDTTSYADNLAADLQGQIDGKVETYSQTSDPSSSWTTTALKTQHTGDLWYNPSTKLTRRWSGTAWVTLQSAEAEEASELAQTKAQIFISTPTVPYYAGDLWFNSASSDIMTCIRDRTSGSYTVSDWQKRNKYTDDTAANAAQQTANSALNSASSASTLANQAKSAADTANANANQASQMAAAVRRDLAVSGAVEINGGNIKSDTVNAMLVDAGVLVGLVISNGNGTFYVDAQGNLTASSADISGKIEADEGRIGSLIINSYGFKSNTVEIQDNPGDPLIWLTMALDGSWSRSNYEADAAIVRAYDQENSPTGWSCHMMSADRSFNSSGQMQLSPNPKVMFEYMDNGIASRRFLLDTMGLSYLNSDYSDYADAFFNIRFAGANIIFSSGDMFIQSSGGSTHVYINGTPY